MNEWITVVVAAIVALSTLGGALLQSWFSNKKFTIEIGRAIDVDDKKRKWEVRSEPLLKLRAELAVMAAKQEKLVASSSTYLDLFGTSDKEEIKEKGKDLRDARDNWNSYLASGILKGILFIQSDDDIVNKVEEILEEYNRAYHFFENYWAIDYEIDDESEKLREAELQKYREVFDNNKTKIFGVQELINKKLEAL